MSLEDFVMRKNCQMSITSIAHIKRNIIREWDAQTDSLTWANLVDSEQGVEGRQTTKKLWRHTDVGQRDRQPFNNEC